MRYRPMLLTEVQALPEQDFTLPPDSPDRLAYQPKLDGWRAIGEVAANGTVTIHGRSGINHTSQFPAIAAELSQAFPGRHVVVDGELTAVVGGKVQFNALQTTGANVIFYLFDLLLDGERLIFQPLSERLTRLEKICTPQPHVQLVASFDHPDDVRTAVTEMGLEGIVVKKLGSRYRPGTRSRDWMKYIINRHVVPRHRYRR